MKKVLALVSGIAIMFSVSTTCLADAAPSPQVGNAVESSVSTSNSISLTLDDALNNVEKNNTEIKLRDEKILLLQRQYNKDLDAYRLASDTGNHGDSSSSVQFRMTQNYNYKQSELQLEYEKHDRADRLKEIKFDLEKQYMSVLSSDESIKNIQDSIVNIDKQMETMNVKINLGQETKDSLESLKTTRAQLVASLNDPKAKKDAAILQIKQYLNIDLNKQLNLQYTKRDFVKFDDSDIDKQIADGVSKDYSLYKKDKSIQLKKLQYDIYNKYFPNMTSTLISLQTSIYGAQYDIDNSKISTEISIWNAYYNLKNQEDSIELEKVNLENAQLNYDSNKAKFNAGQIDALKLESYELALQKEKINLENLINNYIVSAKEFSNQLGK